MTTPTPDALATHALLHCTDLVRSCDTTSAIRHESLIRDERGLTIGAIDGTNALRFDFAPDVIPESFAALPHGVWRGVGAWPAWGSGTWRISAEQRLSGPTISCEAYTARGKRSPARDRIVCLRRAESSADLRWLWDKGTEGSRAPLDASALRSVLAPLHHDAQLRLYRSVGGLAIKVQESPLGAWLPVDCDPFDDALILAGPLEWALDALEICGEPVILELPVGAKDDGIGETRSAPPVVVRAGIGQVLVSQCPIPRGG